MSKWKIFGKSKQEKNTESVDTEEKTEEFEEISEEQDDKPLAEYKETLQTGQKNKTTHTSTDQGEQRVWRNVDKIEDNIDTLHIKKAEKPVTELDKKVDNLIKKNKNKRKPSNVIYVVSKPQPGEVKGDWAVRGHGKIYSHHKTKEKAIEEARKLAIKREATVMVQNTDGTFSDGFKPRSK